MATILRGKRKGEEVTIGQFCNDWVMVQDVAGNPRPMGLTALKFNDEEMNRILTNPNPGILFQCFERIPFENRFRRKRVEKLGEMKGL